MELLIMLSSQIELYTFISATTANHLRAGMKLSQNNCGAEQF